MKLKTLNLALNELKVFMKKKGYSKDWIGKRLRGVAVRQKLTDEWTERGVQKPIDYAILTNDIMKGAFSLKVDEYKKVKGIERENLRDHMTDLELIITMLGEATTTEITQQRNSQGMSKLRNDAKDGCAVAGRARKDIEQQTGTVVISEKNSLSTKKIKLIQE
jgi:DNA-damage-inducible protein D